MTLEYYILKWCIIFTHISGAEFSEIIYKREVLRYFGAVCEFVNFMALL